jgi:hypothetical protein
MTKSTIVFPQYGTGHFPYIWAVYQGNERSFDHAITTTPDATPKPAETIAFDWIHGARLAAFFVANMPESMLGIVEGALYKRRRNESSEPNETRTANEHAKLDITFEHIERTRVLAQKIAAIKGSCWDRDHAIEHCSATLGAFILALCDELEQLVEYAEKQRAR